MPNYLYIKNTDGTKVTRRKPDADFSRKANNYTDVAVYYDFDANGLMNADLPFYLELAASSGAHTVLDLFCGTGRVAIELAKAGYEVTALDSSLPMLEVFETKMCGLDAETERRIDIVLGNAIDFSLCKKFDLIVMPYRSFQQIAHRLEAQNCLSCVKDHLTVGGRFVLSVYRPKRVLDEQWLYPKTKQWVNADADGNTVTKYHWGKKIDLEHHLMYPVLCYEIDTPSGEKKVLYEDLTLKYYYYDELTLMLSLAGFETEAEYGGYDRCKIDAGTEYIFVAQ